MICERRSLSFGKFYYHCFDIKLSGDRTIVLFYRVVIPIQLSFGFVLQLELAIVCCSTVDLKWLYWKFYRLFVVECVVKLDRKFRSWTRSDSWVNSIGDIFLVYHLLSCVSWRSNKWKNCVGSLNGLYGTSSLIYWLGLNVKQKACSPLSWESSL